MVKPKAKGESSWLDEYPLKTPKQRQFLAALAVAATFAGAERASKVTTKSHFQWMKIEGKDGDVYREAAAEAKRRGCDALVDEARERALKGVKTAVWFKGKVVGWEFVKDTTLLIFLMKGAMPETYRDRVDVKSDAPTLEQIVAAANKFQLVPPAEKPAKEASGA